MDTSKEYQEKKLLDENDNSQIELVKDKQSSGKSFHKEPIVEEKKKNCFQKDEDDDNLIIEEKEEDKDEENEIDPEVYTGFN